MVTVLNRCLAIEESSRKRDPEKAALSSIITTVGSRFDLHLSVLSRQEDTDVEKTISITCSKIEKTMETSGAPSPKRQRTGE